MKMLKSSKVALKKFCVRYTYRDNSPDGGRAFLDWINNIAFNKTKIVGDMVICRTQVNDLIDVADIDQLADMFIAKYRSIKQ